MEGISMQKLKSSCQCGWLNLGHKHVKGLTPTTITLHVISSIVSSLAELKLPLSNIHVRSVKISPGWPLYMVLNVHCRGELSAIRRSPLICDAVGSPCWGLWCCFILSHKGTSVHCLIGRDT